MSYLIKRAVAYLLDTVINVFLCLAGFILAMWSQDLNPELIFTSNMSLLVGLFLFVFNWGVITAQEVAFQTSLGKRIFGLVIEGSASALFLRAFFFIPSVVFGGAGLLWCLFDKKKRCWHDLVVNHQPVDMDYYG